MIEYTKGPWKWNRVDRNGTLQLEGSGEMPDQNPIVVAYKCSNNDGLGCHPEQDPMCPLEPYPDERKLIAASPELYEACRSFFKSLSPDIDEFHLTEDWEKVKKALDRINDDSLKIEGKTLKEMKDEYGLH